VAKETFYVQNTKNRVGVAVHHRNSDNLGLRSLPGGDAGDHRFLEVQPMQNSRLQVWQVQRHCRLDHSPAKGVQADR
jgi:hypothetical protein